MLFPPTLKLGILLYELLRIFVLCAVRVGRSVVMLPATWYAAVPLLALPLVLQLLYQLERGHSVVYGRLYLLTKGLSTLGCLIYAIRTLGSALSEASGINYYALTSSMTFGLFVLFFLIDAILLLMVIRRKREKQKGGANDASCD